MQLPDLIVTNFKRRITGVTTTALRVAAEQKKSSSFSVELCGPNQPLSLWHVLANGWQRTGRAKQRIWHVRRNNEMVWGIIARDVFRQPIKLVFTSAAIRKHSAFPRWLISKMDAVVATSELAASFVPHVEAVVGHGVDTTSFRPEPNRPSDPIRLICVGRVRLEKGTDLIVDALCEILPEYPSVTMQFAGMIKTSDKAFYKQQVDKLERANVSSQVTWLGEVAPSNLPSRLASCHILVAAPSYEGFGLTPFEAMASGLATVCTDTGAFAAATGVSDCPRTWMDAEVKQGSSGLLINRGDKAALTKAIKMLLSDKVLTNQLSESGVRRAATEFTIENEALKLEQVYRKVLEFN